jgi:hypothetical protein
VALNLSRGSFRRVHAVGNRVEFMCVRLVVSVVWALLFGLTELESRFVDDEPVVPERMIYGEDVLHDR